MAGYHRDAEDACCLKADIEDNPLKKRCIEIEHVVGERLSVEMNHDSDTLSVTVTCSRNR